MTDKYHPSEEWFDVKLKRISAYRESKSNKNYATSDAIRKELSDAGYCDFELGETPKWHGVYESKESRYSRLKDIK